MSSSPIPGASSGSSTDVEKQYQEQYLKQQDAAADVEKSPSQQQQQGASTEPDFGPPPNGGLAAWMVVLGGFCTVFASFGWINCIKEVIQAVRQRLLTWLSRYRHISRLLPIASTQGILAQHRGVDPFCGILYAFLRGTAHPFPHRIEVTDPNITIGSPRWLYDRPARPPNPHLNRHLSSCFRAHDDLNLQGVLPDSPLPEHLQCPWLLVSLLCPYVFPPQSNASLPYPSSLTNNR